MADLACHSCFILVEKDRLFYKKVVLSGSMYFHTYLLYTFIFENAKEAWDAKTLKTAAAFCLDLSYKHGW